MYSVCTVWYYTTISCARYLSVIGSTLFFSFYRSFMFLIYSNTVGSAAPQISTAGGSLPEFRTSDRVTERQERYQVSHHTSKSATTPPLKAKYQIQIWPFPDLTGSTSEQIQI